MLGQPLVPGSALARVFLQAEHVPLRSRNGGQAGVMHTIPAAWAGAVSREGARPKVKVIGM